MVGDPDGVLSEGGVVVAVGVGGGGAEVLQIVVRHRVGVGAEWRQRQSGFLRFEGEGVDFDFVEKVFTALLAGEEIVDRSNEGVAAEFEGVVAGIEAEGFGELGAVFAGGARELIGASDAIDDVGNFDEGAVGVGVGLAQVAGELGAKMADEARA